LPRHFHQKVLSVHPPIELPGPGGDGLAFRRQHDLGEGPLVGFLGRFSEEKGISYLIESVPLVLRDIPNARYVLAGPTATVPGERVHEQLRSRIEALGSTVVHVGLLPDEELGAFYRAIDVLTLPSTNSTESFGMTQAEAMLAGTPVVASDMPGVRETIRLTGMGLLAPPADAQALAAAIVAVLRNPAKYARPEQEIRSIFDPERTATFYEQLFASLLSKQAFSPQEATAPPSATRRR
jgi:glycosyltransferase involved in cell wall biosynthesis